MQPREVVMDARNEEKQKIRHTRTHGDCADRREHGTERTEQHECTDHGSRERRVECNRVVGPPPVLVDWLAELQRQDNGICTDGVSAASFDFERHSLCA